MSKLKVYKTDSWVGDLKIRKGSEWKPATDVKTYNVKFDPTSVGAKLLKIDGDIGHLNILKITDTTVLKNELSKFEYLNDYSKSFGTTDGEVPNSEFWSIISGTPDIQNSSLHLVSDGATDEIVESTFYVSGDFSTEVDINLTSVSVSSWACEFKLYVDDNNYYKILRMYDAGSGRHAIDVYSMIGGVYTELTTNNQGLIDDVKFKFVRVGNTLYCRYWIGGASWVDLVTIPSCLTDDFKIRFESNVWDTNPSIDFYFDNFKIENPDAIVHTTELHPDEIYVEVKDDNLYKYFSDAFVGVDDTLPNTQYWNDIPFASKSLKIYGNRLGGVVANQWPNTESVFKLQGDFDIQTDYLVDSVTNPQGWYVAMWLYADNDDRMGIERSYADRGGLGNYYTFDRVISSTWTPIYAVPTTAGELSGKFRITRDGTTLRAFYWNNTVGGWSLIGTQEFVDTDLRVTYYLGTISGDNVLTAYFTDVFINSADSVINFNKTIDDITPTIETAKESKILVQNVAGDGSDYTITINSNPIIYTKQAGDTITDISTGLGNAVVAVNPNYQFTVNNVDVNNSNLIITAFDNLTIVGDDQGTYKTEFVDVKDQVLSTDKLPWMRRYSGGVWR